MDWQILFQIMRLDEEGAQAKYRAAAAMATDPKLKELFERFAYEEEVHAALLLQEEQKILGANKAI